MLQNNHNFISDNRLCIHNLPAKLDDKKLRQLFLEAAKDKKAQILWVIPSAIIVVRGIYIYVKFKCQLFYRLR